MRNIFFNDYSNIKFGIRNDFNSNSFTARHSFSQLPLNRPKNTKTRTQSILKFQIRFLFFQFNFPNESETRMKN